MNRSLESFKNMMEYTDKEKLVEMLYESCKQEYEMEEEIKALKKSLEGYKKHQENLNVEIIKEEEEFTDFLEEVIYALNKMVEEEIKVLKNSLEDYKKLY